MPDAPKLLTAAILQLIATPGGLARWLAHYEAGGASQLNRYLVHLHETVRSLFAAQPPGKGAIRLEDWSDWPQEQREAYEALRDFAGMAPYLSVMGTVCRCPGKDREGSRCTHEPGRCRNPVEAVALEGVCIACQQSARGNPPAEAV